MSKQTNLWELSQRSFLFDWIVGLERLLEALGRGTEVCHQSQIAVPREITEVQLVKISASSQVNQELKELRYHMEPWSFICDQVVGGGQTAQRADTQAASLGRL